MTESEFDEAYADALDKILAALAESSEVDPQKFFNLTCVLENLRFFSPVLYGAILKQEK